MTSFIRHLSCPCTYRFSFSGLLALLLLLQASLTGAGGDLKTVVPVPINAIATRSDQPLDLGAGRVDALFEQGRKKSLKNNGAVQVQAEPPLFGSAVTFSGTGCPSASTTLTAPDERKIVSYAAFGPQTTNSINVMSCSISIPLNLQGRCFPGVSISSFLAWDLPASSQAVFKRQVSIGGRFGSIKSFSTTKYGPSNGELFLDRIDLRSDDLGLVCDQRVTLLVESSVTVQGRGAAPVQAWIDEQDFIPGTNYPDFNPEPNFNSSTGSQAVSSTASENRSNSASRLKPVGLAALLLWPVIWAMGE